METAYYSEEIKFYVSVDCITIGFNQKELKVLLSANLKQNFYRLMAINKWFPETEGEISKRPQHMC